MEKVDINNIELQIINSYHDEVQKAILIRCVEEKLLELFSDGQLNGTVHTCVGQEFAAVFIAKYLIVDDHVVSNHRGHGHYLSRFEDVKGLIGEVMGKPSGCCRGIGGSQHLVNKNYLSNGIQGGMVPIAAGIAMDMKLKKQDSISVAFIGDGTLGEGIIYESFNIASNWELPLLVVLENNQYAQSTSHKQTFSGDIRKRIEGFGMEYFECDTWDIDNLNETSKSAIEYVRTIKKPAFIQIKTYRLNSHSKGDDNRSQVEVNQYKEKDVLNKIFAQDFDYVNVVKAGIIEKINEVIEELKKESITTIPVSKEIINHEIEKIDNTWISENSKRFNDEIYEALKVNFHSNPQLLMVGEDIENNNNFNENQYGGAFKVTRDLSNLFKARVINTPISEAAITGIAIGYSTRGNSSIVEIMFGDFTTLIFDQLVQHASKFQYMFNDMVKCPVIIRTPMGGKRGYGPTHSQSIEKHFIGIPNLGVTALNHRISPKIIYNSILNNYESPFIVVENKVLYTRSLDTHKIAGYNYVLSNHLFPSLTVSPKKSLASLTIACYGELLFDIEQAVKEIFEDEEYLCEIVCDSMISPVQIKAVFDSVQRTKNLLIIEEGNNQAAWGSEIIAKLVEKGTDIKRLKRLSNNHIIPAELSSELNNIPSIKSIKREIISFI